MREDFCQSCQISYFCMLQYLSESLQYAHCKPKYFYSWGYALLLSKVSICWLALLIWLYGICNIYAFKHWISKHSVIWWLKWLDQYESISKRHEETWSCSMLLFTISTPRSYWIEWSLPIKYSPLRSDLHCHLLTYLFLANRNIFLDI